MREQNLTDMEMEEGDKLGEVGEKEKQEKEKEAGKK